MQPASLIAEFRSEASDHLALLDAELLKLERQPWDGERVRRMFLAAHSIKGGAAMLRLGEVQELAHAMEDVLAYLRDQKEPVRGDTADLLFRSIDALRSRLAPDSQESDDATPVAELVDRLHHHLTAPAPAGPPSAPADEPGGAPRALLVENSPTLRALEGMILSDAGYSVHVTDDGGEALDIATSQPCRLLVTGMEIKGLRGLDLAAAIRADARTRDLPIAVLTNDEIEEDRRRATELCVEYIRRDRGGNQRLQEMANMIQRQAPR